MNPGMIWALKEVKSTNETIRDWRSQCAQKTVSTYMKHIPHYAFSNIGTTLHHFLKIILNETEPHNDVTGTLYQFSFFQEAF